MPADPLLALTLWPEWAWAICALGKRVENRPWRPVDAQRHGRGPTTADRARVLHALPVGARLAIHAGAHLGGRPGRVATDEAVNGVLDMCERVNPNGLLPYPGVREALRACPKSAIVAVVTIDGFDREERTGWDVPGAWHWRLRDVVVLPEPIPCRGAQGLWKAPDSAVAALKATGVV